MKIRIRKAGIILTYLYKQVNIICTLPKKTSVLHFNLDSQYKKITQRYIKNRLESGSFCFISDSNDNFFYEPIIFQELEIDETMVKKSLLKYYSNFSSGDSVIRDVIKEINLVKFTEEPYYDA